MPSDEARNLINFILDDMVRDHRVKGEKSVPLAYRQELAQIIDDAMQPQIDSLFKVLWDLAIEAGMDDDGSERTAAQLAENISADLHEAWNQQPKWTRVEDGLPKRKDADETGRVLARSLEDFTGLFEWDHVKENPDEFSCWMPISPLPPPPKEDR